MGGASSQSPPTHLANELRRWIAAQARLTRATPTKPGRETAPGFFTRASPQIEADWSLRRESRAHCRSLMPINQRPP